MDSTDFDDIFWQGDLNWDLSRSNGFANTMRRFMDKIGLVSLWEKHPVDYTHIHTNCGPIHIGDNRSRHSPIMVKLLWGLSNLKGQF